MSNTNNADIVWRNIKRAIERSGLLSSAKAKVRHVKDSIKNRKERLIARKRWLKKQRQKLELKRDSRRR